MIDKKSVVELCDEILKRQIKIEWCCQSRVDNVDKHVLEKMREAGCLGAWCGVESGSQRILNFLKKGTTIGKIKKAYELMKEFDFKTGAGFMIGIPGETMEDIRMSIELAKEINPDWAYFQSFVAFPKSDLYHYVIDNKLYDFEWNNIYRVKPDFLGLDSLRELEDQLHEEFLNHQKKYRSIAKH